MDGEPVRGRTVLDSNATSQFAAPAESLVPAAAFARHTRGVRAASHRRAKACSEDRLSAAVRPMKAASRPPTDGTAEAMQHFEVQSGDLAFDGVIVAEHLTFMEVMADADVHLYS